MCKVCINPVCGRQVQVGEVGEKVLLHGGRL